MSRALVNRALRPQWLLIAGMALLLAGCDEGKEPAAGGQEQMPPSAVTLETLQRGSMERVEEYPARIRGVREVQVRARVPGILLERTYAEGSEVAQGDVLFRIDPDQYSVQVQQAQAAVATARAERDQADRDWTRAQQLFARGALSASERDRARTQKDFAMAGLAQAEARLDEAELNLSYTDVKAPLSGVTSLEVQPEGSLLEMGALLTTIVQQDQVHVTFALPESDMALLREAQRTESTVGREVRLELVDGSEYARSGQIDFTASTIDAATGTVTVRALFDNPEAELIPGQFARVRLVIQRYQDQLFVPADTVGGSEQGASVFIANDELKAEVRPVELGPLINGKRLVLSGLKEGDRLVVNGHAGLMPGAALREAGSAAANEGDN